VESLKAERFVVYHASSTSYPVLDVFCVRKNGTEGKKTGWREENKLMAPETERKALFSIATLGIFLGILTFGLHG